MENADKQYTFHAFLVAWGVFAQHLALPERLQQVSLHQKSYKYTPHTKVLELLVATLAGLPHLQDISYDAHPLERDQAVAEAWGQPGWAHYTGVSRTLSALTLDEVQDLIDVLEEISQPFIDQECRLVHQQGKRLCLDGDLTGLPVSNGSRTYPEARYGHMNGDIRLGYQAALVSMVSPTYGRLWLTVAHHPGDTISCTQAEALALAAEQRLGRRPRRRTEKLRMRLQQMQEAINNTQKRWEAQQRRLEKAKEQLQEAQETYELRLRQYEDLAKRYRAEGREETPYSALNKARTGVQTAQKRIARRQRDVAQAQKRWEKTQGHLEAQQEAWRQLQARLVRFEQDNATNTAPMAMEFRLDAGFGTYENVALLIEMGYEVYIKAYSHRVVTYLRNQVDEAASWTRVGANAEMIGWADYSLPGSPYPLDVSLVRYHTGKNLRYSVLLHFGEDTVTQDLSAWFHHYNGRQTIEAGIKEAKHVFHLHRIKVRSKPAIILQEYLVTFAANLIRWARHWLSRLPQVIGQTLDVQRLGVKHQVQIGTHISAQVISGSEGTLLKFTEASVFAGKCLYLPAAKPRTPRPSVFALLKAFFVKWHLIAQPLR